MLYAKNCSMLIAHAFKWSRDQCSAKRKKMEKVLFVGRVRVWDRVRGIAYWFELVLGFGSESGIRAQEL